MSNAPTTVTVTITKVVTSCYSCPHYGGDMDCLVGPKKGPNELALYLENRSGIVSGGHCPLLHNESLRNIAGRED